MLIASATALLAIAPWGIIDALRSSRALNTLRDRCFITNEKGHRVKYREASPERQAKAECV